MTSYLKKSSNRRSDSEYFSDTMDDDTDDKDDTKRKSRNLSEKKRRDQFNMLINELSSMVSTNSRKMDKSTVLKSTIAFLKNHDEIAVRSRVHEIQEEWKPAFLSNEEFTHLILEALDGFIMVFSSSGRILYTSESITSLLGHLPNDLLNMTIYDMIFDEDQSELYNMLLNPATTVQYNDNTDNQVSFVCHCKRGNLNDKEDATYELVQFVGYFRADMESLKLDNRVSSNCMSNTHNSSSCNNNILNNGSSHNSAVVTNRFGSYSNDSDTRLVFVGTGRLQTPQLIREMSIVDAAKSEFTSRHSLEWKFLFLDHRFIKETQERSVKYTMQLHMYNQGNVSKCPVLLPLGIHPGHNMIDTMKLLDNEHLRAPPIIGYLPFEVLGTSGYDYYHVDDLEKVVSCHEALMQKGEGTSCYYRFLTKGQQWIWLQTRFFITYHQWNSKPEFIVCTHRVVSYANVMKQMRREMTGSPVNESEINDVDEFSSESCDIQRDSNSRSSRQLRHHQHSNSERWSNTTKPSTTRSHGQRHVHSHAHRRSAGASNSDSGIPHSSRQNMSSSLQSRRSCHLPASSGEGVGGLASRNCLGNTSDSNSMSADSPAPQRPTRRTHNSRNDSIEVQQQQQLAAVQQSTSSYMDSSQQAVQPTPVSTSQPISDHYVSQQQVAVVQPTAAVPVLASGYHSMAAAATPLVQISQPTNVESNPPQQAQSQPLLMTTAQIRLQDQLQRKHEQLQQTIIQQQDELRRVSEQLMMARCGFLPQVINVTVPITHSTAPVTSSLYIRSPQMNSPPLTMCASSNSDPNRSHHIVIENHPVIDDMLPFQFSQQQAQLFFTSSDVGSPATTQHSQ